jgi:DNA-binding HxlR family transcriptional regulator
LDKVFFKFMRSQIKVGILKVLLRAPGPMGVVWLVTALQALFPQVLSSDVLSCVNELEEQGFVVGSRDEVTEQAAYGLTMKGELAAKKHGG